MRSEVKAYRLVSAVLAYCLVVSTVTMPFHLVSMLTDPWRLTSTVAVVAPPINAGGFLYDRTTGAMLYDAVTGAALYA